MAFKELLSEKQRQWIETNELPGSYKSPEKIEKGVKDNAEKIPKTLLVLISDVELLSQNGYLSRDSWKSSWYELMEVDEHATDEEKLEAFRFDLERNDHPGSAPAELGQKLGHLAFYLTRIKPPDIRRERMWADLIWGFFVGIALHPHVVEYNEYERRESIKDELLNHLSIRATHDTHFNTGVVQSLDRLVNTPQTEEQHLRDTVAERYPDAPTRFTEDVRMAIENEYTVTHISEIPAQENAPIEEILTPEVVRDTIERNRLIERGQLRKTMQVDAEKLVETSYKDVTDATAMLAEIAENEPIRSAAIANTEIAKWRGSVTKLARDLQDPDWAAPLVRGTKNNWKTTPYGAVLVHYLQSSELVQETSPLHEVPEQTIEAALDELDESNPERGSDRDLP